MTSNLLARIEAQEARIAALESQAAENTSQLEQAGQAMRRMVELFGELLDKLAVPK